jgi:hypothetical protein
MSTTELPQARLGERCADSSPWEIALSEMSSDPALTTRRARKER